MNRIPLILALCLMAGCAMGQSKTTKFIPPVPIAGITAIYFDPSMSAVMCSSNGGPFHLCTDKEVIHVLEPKPEPMDVPAIYVHPECKGGCVPPPSYWSCADKSRIVLTAEDGTKHCIKFPKEKP